MLPKYKNKGFNLVQLTNAWNIVSLSVQKGQPASISGFMIEIKALTATAPWRTLHCKSPVFLVNGGLYNALHSGFLSIFNLKYPRHGVSTFLFNIFLLKLITQHLYKTFPVLKKKSKHMDSKLSRNTPEAPSKFKEKHKQGKESLGFGLQRPSLYSVSRVLSVALRVDDHFTNNCATRRIDLKPKRWAVASSFLKSRPAIPITVPSWWLYCQWVSC